jgi:hypothetical protein
LSGSFCHRRALASAFNGTPSAGRLVAAMPGLLHVFNHDAKPTAYKSGLSAAAAACGLAADRATDAP